MKMTVIYDFSQFCFGCLVPLMVFEWLSFVLFFYIFTFLIVTTGWELLASGG